MELDLKYKRFNCSRKIGCLLISTIRLYYFVKQPQKLTSQFPELVRPAVRTWLTLSYPHSGPRTSGLILSESPAVSVLLSSFGPKLVIWFIWYGLKFNPALAQTDLISGRLFSLSWRKKIIDLILGALELLFLNKNGLESTFNKHNRQNTINFHSKSGILMGIATDFNS